MSPLCEEHTWAAHGEIVVTFRPIPINLDTFQSTASRGKSAECVVSGGEGAFSSHISHVFWQQKDIVRQFINVLYQNLGKLIWNKRINNLLIKEKERKKTDPRCNRNIWNYIPDISPCTVIAIYILTARKCLETILYPLHFTNNTVKCPWNLANIFC